MVDNIIMLLSPKVVELSQDPNGFHIIEKFLFCFKFPKTQFIYDAFSENVLKIGTDRQGCCLFQKCLTSGSFKQKVFI